MTIDARHRVLHVCTLLRLRVRQRIQCFKAFDQIAVTCTLVSDVHAAMTMQARARLWRGLLPLGENLVVEHICVTALLAKILRESVTGPELDEARILLEA